MIDTNTIIMLVMLFLFLALLIVLLVFRDKIKYGFSRMFLKAPTQLKYDKVKVEASLKAIEELNYSLEDKLKLLQKLVGNDVRVLVVVDGKGDCWIDTIGSTLLDHLDTEPLGG